MTEPIEFMSFEAAAQLWVYEPATGLIRSRESGRIVSNSPSEPSHYSSVYVPMSIRHLSRGSAINTARLAWLLVHGTWPANVIDHINGDRHDNRLVNLRDVPHSINQRNQNYHRAGMSRPDFAAARRAARVAKPRHFLIEAEFEA